VADIDGDGDLDAISANFNGDEVAWYANNGGSPPTWTKHLVTFAVGAWGTHLADLDGDGDVDAIVGYRLDGADHIGVQWYENNGGATPSFTSRRVSAAFVEAASVEAADLDGDGDRDVLSVDVFGDRVLWFENGGQHPPVWTQRTLTTATNEPWTVSPVDLDRDGDVDVVTASGSDNTVAWYENGGQRPPVWTRHVITSAATQAIDAVAADLDGDVDLDVASAGNQGQVAWYENVGVGTPSFVTHVVSTECGRTGSIRVGRLDPDADVDLVAGCEDFGEIQWFPNLLDFVESDGDGVPDTLDCAPADAGAFAVPAEIRGDVFAAGQLTWSSEALRSGPGTVYDVMRGRTGHFPVGSDAAETCAVQGTSATSLPPDQPPALGEAFYYLVRGENACGVGTYGFASGGAERTNMACP
jgi:hypothetical protein